MKVLILGASGFLGGILYNKIKEDTDYWVLGTYYQSKKYKDLIKLDVKNFIDVKTFLEHLNPDVVVWCLTGKEKERELIDEGLPVILSTINPTCKFIFMSTNAVFGKGEGDFSEEDAPSYKNSEASIALYSKAKIDGEKLAKDHKDNIIIRSGAIYGQDIQGKWDIRVSQLIEELAAGKAVMKPTNLINTFVEVNELAAAIIKLIEIDYKGVIHLGPERNESYYDFFKKMADKLNLDEGLILPELIDEKQAIETGILLDTSLNTRKCREELGIHFSNIEATNKDNR